MDPLKNWDKLWIKLGIMVIRFHFCHLLSIEVKSELTGVLNGLVGL